MAGGFHTIGANLQDGNGVPASSKVTANSRVTTSMGPISVATDMLAFPGPSTVGNWLVPLQRVLIGGIPAIGQSSTGQAVVPTVPTVTVVPVTVTTPDTRASGS